MNSKVKQLLQLNYDSEQFKNVHAPTSRCTLGAQKVCSILDKFLVTGIHGDGQVDYGVRVHPVQQFLFTDILSKILQNF